MYVHRSNPSDPTSDAKRKGTEGTSINSCQTSLLSPQRYADGHLAVLLYDHPRKEFKYRRYFVATLYQQTPTADYSTPKFQKAGWLQLCNGLQGRCLPPFPVHKTSGHQNSSLVFQCYEERPLRCFREPFTTDG